MTAYAQFTAQALHRYPFGEVHQVATQADNGGDVLQLADGRIAIVQGAGGGNDAVAVGDMETLRTVGTYQFPVVSGITASSLANGTLMYWDPVAIGMTTSGGNANGSYYAGPLVMAKAAGIATCLVDINILPPNTQDLDTFGILAAAGSISSGAAQIVSQRCYVTGANGTKAVKLPAPAQDLAVTVINEANAMLLIIGHGSETIDGIAGATGINVPGVCVITFRSDGTNWYSQRGELSNGLTSLDTGAPTGTNSTNGYQIFGSVYFPAQAGINGTVGAILPAPAAGLQMTVINDNASNALKLYSLTGNINGTVGTTAYSLAAGKVGFFVSDGTNWRAMISA